MTDIIDDKVKIAIPTGLYVAAKTSTGAKSMNNGDVVAIALSGRTLEQTLFIAAEMTGIAVDELEERYIHLNQGQQRMNLGNRIRGAVNKHTKAFEKGEFEQDGGSYLAVIAEGYPAPELPVKEVKAA